MTTEEYTARVKALVAEGIEKLREAEALMKEHGDQARAMDLDEAVGYAESSVEES